MICLDDQHFMMIEPSAPAAEPLMDGLTAKAVAVCRLARHKIVKGHPEQWLGEHRCACGKESDNFTWIMPDGRETNSLMIHYVECHRNDVPRGEIAKLLCYALGV